VSLNFLLVPGILALTTLGQAMASDPPDDLLAAGISIRVETARLSATQIDVTRHLIESLPGSHLVGLKQIVFRKAVEGSTAWWMSV
jgi:hypothetical protein